MSVMRRDPAEPMVPARLLDDVRVSMETLRQGHVAAWDEVERLHHQLRGAVKDAERWKEQAAVATRQAIELDKANEALEAEVARLLTTAGGQ